MRLVVQIPCLNEEETIAETIAEIPREIPGCREVLVLVVDDGSTDGTGRRAREAGADWVVRHRRRRGLAAAYQTGIETALLQGADLIVNTDGDHQYWGREIPRLVTPILAGTADLVIGDRQVPRNATVSRTRRFLTSLGSWIVSRAAGVVIPDAVSGFRALSAEAARKLPVLTSFSYTIETLLIAADRGLAIKSIPVATRQTDRPSRLFGSVWEFVMRSGLTILAVWWWTRPGRILGVTAGLLVGTGLVCEAARRAVPVESSAAAIWPVGWLLILLGCQCLIGGLLSELLKVNRLLLLRTLEAAGPVAASCSRDGVAGTSSLSLSSDGLFPDNRELTDVIALPGSAEPSSGRICVAGRE